MNIQTSDPCAGARRTRPGRWQAIGTALWLGANALCAATVRQASIEASVPRQATLTLSKVLAADPDLLSSLPIELRNLACAEGLPGMSADRAAEALHGLETMAAAVRQETDRQLPRHRAHPNRETPTEAQFRMLALVTVLQRDLGVHYNPERAAANANGPEPTEKFFADPVDLFLHGAAGPGRAGTCSSLPVLYVAVGRRLGYPLRLVRARAHLFVRWDAPGERFNVEATCVGYVSRPDAYYRSWPLPMTPALEQAERLLTSLDAAGETSVFLHNRALCLMVRGRYREAGAAAAAALRLDPHSSELRRLVHEPELRSESAP